MLRPCFLVIDREYSGSISTRKLVIETAKFNVLTAYSASEAVQIMTAFPRIHGIVLDAAIRDMDCGKLIEKFREIDPRITIVVISSPGAQNCPNSDHLLQNFEPGKLLALLQSLLPAETAEIEEQNEQLNRIQP